MKVRLKLKPGQRGTIHHLKKYGDQLLCVRYRYDEKSNKRFTTVELIVAEEPWRPRSRKPETIVQLRVAFGEVELRGKIKEAGGRWNKNNRVWELPFKTVRSLDLTKRIVEEE